MNCAACNHCDSIACDMYSKCQGSQASFDTTDAVNLEWYLSNFFIKTFVFTFLLLQ